jgi:tetratricopeptide (TPR) repeat protein
MAVALPAPGFDVFLSYNSRDRVQVQAAETALRSAGLRICVDYRHLTPGRAWITELEKLLSESSSVVVFVGANGFGRWQSQELQLALDLDKHVIPVLLPDLKDDPPLGFLRLRTWIDLRRDTISDLSAAIRGTPEAEPEKSKALCPYRGLAYFREEDADLYFGRESRIEELAAQLGRCRFVAVTGPSGTGKSSFLRAGLARRLHQDPDQSWEILSIVPHQEPLLELGRALALLLYPEDDRIERSRAIARNLSSGEVPLRDYAREVTERTEGLRLLLTVDQFEEVYTVSFATEVEVFIRELLDASTSGSLTVVIAYSADFHGYVTSHNGLTDRLRTGHFILDPMKPDQLRAAIEKPAARAGLPISAALTDQLLLDAAAEPGNLPLLEFVLRQLWETRSVTLDSYHALGNLHGALSRYADGVYGELGAAEQISARRVFLKAIRAGESGQDTRRRATRAEIGDADWAVVPILASKRLLVTSRSGDAECVEICHEALIRHWQELRKWLEEDREFLFWRDRLDGHMEEWRSDGSSLLSGYPLATAVEWFARRHSDLSAEERSYIRASIAWQDAQSRKSARIKRLIVASSVAAVLAIAGAWSIEHRERKDAAANYLLAVKAATSTSRVVKEHLLPDGVEQSKSALAKSLLKDSSATFENVHGHDDREAALARVQLFEVLWNNYAILDDWPNAENAARHEFEVAQHWGKSDPSNANWLLYMARAEENMGDYEREFGNLESADDHFKDALQLATRLSDEHSEAAWRYELAHAHERFGDVLRGHYRFKEALGQFETFLNFADEAQNSGKVDWRRNVAIVHGKIGDMLLEQSDPKGAEKAEKEFETDLQMSRTLASEVQGEADLQRGVAIAYERLGFVQRRQHNFKEAVSYYQLELGVLKDLLEKDNQNHSWLRAKAIANEGLGDVERDQKNPGAALPYYKCYLQIVEAMFKQSQESSWLRRDTAVGYQRLGDTNLHLGRMEDARKQFQLCIGISKGATPAFDPRNPEPRHVGEECEKQLKAIAQN